MYEWFQEIAFEAEINTEEYPELLELAKELCNENQATRDLAITELRQMIFEKKACFPYRTDDAFLLKFLRVKNFIVPRAHKLCIRYCTFREQNKQLYDGVDLWGLARVKDVVQSVIYDHPDVGRISILKPGAWSTNEFPVEDIVRAATMLEEVGLRQPKLQFLGLTIIIDFEDMSHKQISAVNSTVAYQIICLLGYAMPTRVRSIHVINYSWLLYPVFYLFKRFLPQQVWDTILFHGSDLKSLQRHFDLKCLPLRYGGTCKTVVNIQQYLIKIKKYRTEQFDKDMQALGYVIKD